MGLLRGRVRRRHPAGPSLERLSVLYIRGPEVTTRYHHPSLLWLILPLMILCLCGVWLLASRGKLREDRVIFALTGRMSLLIGAGVALLAWLAVRT